MSIICMTICVGDWCIITMAQSWMTFTSITVGFSPQCFISVSFMLVGRAASVTVCLNYIQIRAPTGISDNIMVMILSGPTL
ncbi:hypothetical protein GDO78_005010 [Eleutherodactylus coqui]|uniref:Uncharacterized protein n=1 Tax=Eleutherodactylus coqui TaxID=57060 RepID=A0A8J6FIV2_ELECQ|nr:hypothetical protein GDO78_005010 [Eleutherodactylus coqui]